MNDPFAGSSKPDSALTGRRAFLQVSAAVAGGLNSLPALAWAQGVREQRPGSDPASDEKEWKNDLIDAHVHVWTPDTKAYPLAPGWTAADMQPPSFTPEQLFTHAKPMGVRRVVLIQMSFYGFDNSYMLDSMHRFPGTFSGVAIVDENAADVREAVRKLHHQGVRGFRIYPGKRPIDEWVGSRGMGSLWDEAGKHRMAIGALINPEALSAIDRMCGQHPQTPVVIDHFARIGMDGAVRQPQLDQLLRLARHPQTHVKISAFYALGKKQAPYTDLAPMIRQLRDAFGAERLMWASDCPYQVQQGHTYRASVELVRDRLDFLSNAERRWLLRGTAEKVFFS